MHWKLIKKYVLYHELRHWKPNLPLDTSVNSFTFQHNSTQRLVLATSTSQPLGSRSANEVHYNKAAYSLVCYTWEVRHCQSWRLVYTPWTTECPPGLTAQMHQIHRGGWPSKFQGMFLPAFLSHILPCHPLLMQEKHLHPKIAKIRWPQLTLLASNVPNRAHSSARPTNAANSAAVLLALLWFWNCYELDISSVL